jgi:splicing factor 3A subunit 1
MKIVRNYKKPEERAAASKGDKATKFAVSPITGELVPMDEMAEHMRISLIDPKWKEQKDAMLKKLQGSNKVDDDQFAKNILSLAKSRPDIFASGNDKDVSTALNEQMKKHQQQQQQQPPALASIAAPTPQPAAPVIPTMIQPPPMMAQQPMPPPPPPPATIATNAGVGQKRGREDGGDDLDAEPVKQKLRIGEMELEDEDNWLDANPGTIKLKILCPDEAKDKNLNGQTIDLEFESGKETVLKIKQELKPLLGNLAQGKMKLEVKKMGFLKDANSLAYYNIKSGASIHLHLKKR